MRYKYLIAPGMLLLNALAYAVAYHVGRLLPMTMDLWSDIIAIQAVISLVSMGVVMAVCPMLGGERRRAE